MVTITFGSFEPTSLFNPLIIKKLSWYWGQACSISLDQKSKDRRIENRTLCGYKDKGDEGWTLVTRRKRQTQFRLDSSSLLPKREKRRTQHRTSSKKKKSTREKTLLVLFAPSIEVLKQPTRRTITLTYYMPKGFLPKDDESSYMVTCYVTHAEDEPSEENLDISDKSSTSYENLDQGDEGLVIDVPVHLRLSDVLLLLENVRVTIAHALTNPAQHKGNLLFNNKEDNYASCMATITFTDEDLQLGSHPHNRPLYVMGHVREHKVRRILIDCGSIVKIMPIHTMRQIGISTDEQSHSKLTIQGFNQGGQCAIDIV